MDNEISNSNLSEKMIDQTYQWNIFDTYEDQNIKIHFIGDVIAKRHYYLANHQNPGYEICMIPYGMGVFNIANHRFVVNPNQIFITRKEQVHGGIASEANPYRIFYVCFSIKKNANDIFKEVDIKLKNLAYPMTQDYHNLIEYYRLIVYEHQKLSNDKWFEGNIKRLYEAFIIAIARDFDENKIQIEKMAKKQNDIVKQILIYIDRNINRTIILEQLATHVGYSVSYLCRRFKKETGITLHKYITRVKMEKARLLMQEGECNITEISDMLGFKTVHHFSKVFKDVYGSSPSRFK